MAKHSIILEIGSSFSAITTKNSSFYIKEPSVVAVDTIDKQTKAVGNNALKMRLSKMADVQLVFPILEGTVVDAERAKDLFKHLISKILPQQAQIFPDATVLCVTPCCLNTSDKRTIENILLSLSIKSVSFIETSIADRAELFKQFHTNRGIIVNVGSDCTDISAIHGKNIVCGCTLYHSGKQLTEAIIQKIREKYILQLSFAEAEKLKIKCASLYSNDTSTCTVLGCNVETGETERITISSRELFDTVTSFCNEYVTVLKSILASLPPEHEVQIKKEGIMLCGGGAQLQGLESFLINALNVPVRLADNCKNVTIEGARQF